ncbi:MAG TPA: MBL fold metallo-hydrolase [Gemmatimonadales bacterium]|nr:MBL fold metallo-hydrolase [Gemmatimonadales bacterium]
MSQPRPGVTRRQALAAGAALAAGSLLGGCPAPPGRAARPAASAGPATRLGPAEPTHYRFRLGDFEVTTISDAGAVIDGPWPIVGEDRPAAEVEALMRGNLLPERKFRPGFTPMLVHTGRELILFDTGNGPNGFVPRPYGGWLAGQLGPAGFTPEQVDVVVLSHLHPDHVGGMMEGGKPLFPRARYVTGQAEYDHWSSTDYSSVSPEENVHKTSRLFRSNVAPLADRFSFVRPEGEVAPGIHAVDAYGHTPGHLAFHLESRGKRLLFWGDCAHHEVASLAHPEWHALFDMDKTQGAATRRRIYQMAAAERIPVVGYHTSFPSVGFVQKAGAGYRWVPVTYQLSV